MRSDLPFLVCLCPTYGRPELLANAIACFVVYVYLPWYLSAHARVLQHHGWSHPSRVWSTYSGRPELENAAGRFHGSVAVTTELLDRIGGTWIQTKRADFDQQFIAALAAKEPPGDPAANDLPAYVFRWTETGASHCQGYMTFPDNEDWYDRYQPSVKEPVADFRSRFDDSAVTLIADLSNRRAQLKSG